jgi:hypothetical protein
MVGNWNENVLQDWLGLLQVRALKRAAVSLS